MDATMKALMDAEEAKDLKEGIKLTSSATQDSHQKAQIKILSKTTQNLQQDVTAKQSIQSKKDAKSPKDFAEEHLLILYNPYYNAEVIEQHWQVLNENGKVAFGKIKSKLRDTETSMLHNRDSLSHFIESTSPDTPLQLFLSDYANLYVCKVVEIATHCNVPAPSYYKAQDIEVELWFIITDMCELVRNDFKQIRDYYLANFITSYNGHTFALYGNDYSYPLTIQTKHEMNFFDSMNSSGEEILHYPTMFKNTTYIQVRGYFVSYIFGEKLLMKLKPDSADNLINAEIEYLANRENPMHDCTGIIMLYGKSMEQEIMRFTCMLLRVLLKFEKCVLRENTLATHCLKFQTNQVNLAEWLGSEARLLNLESYKQLLILKKVKKIFTQWRAKEVQMQNTPITQTAQNAPFSLEELESFSTKKLPHFVTNLQKVRNPAAHESKVYARDIVPLRAQILGVGCESMLVSLLRILVQLEEKLQSM